MSRRSWENPPPRVYLAGSETYLRGRELRKAILGAEIGGRTVHRVSSQEDLEDVMEGSVMFTSTKLVIVEDPESVDPELIRDHKDSDTTLLLYRTGDPDKKDAVWGVIPKAYRLHYQRPPKWKMLDHRVRFFQKEVESHGLSVSRALSEAVVRRVGDDLGVLAFESLKACLYRQVLGGKEITPDIIKGTLSLTGPVDMEPLVAALITKDEAQVLKACHRIQSNSGGNPHVAVVLPANWIASNALKWFQCCLLMEQGASVSEGASRMGLPPFVYEKILSPQAQAFGKQGSKYLLQSMASLESSRRKSPINPWIDFEVSLVKACRVAKGTTDVPFAFIEAI